MNTSEHPALARISRLILATIALLVPLAASAVTDIKRTKDGKPDLSGTYNVATLTPLQRPEAFGDNLYLSPEDAKKIEETAKAQIEATSQASDPNREAPPEGGDGSEGAAGNVGGYNSFWIDTGDSTFLVDGKFRTSIITSPDNGRQPELTDDGKKRAFLFYSRFGENKGDAWWIGEPGPGPYDDPELRPLGERCLLGFGSTGGPPMLPVLYNNLKRIVQTPDHIMILIEMVHDARIIRMNAKHLPDTERKWLGDSIGWWEKDTLVVDTTNFSDKPALYLADENLHVVERFTPQADGNLLYQFKVEDPTVWSEPWSGEYPWPTTEDKVYEYACHEGNYALGNILRGARRLEQEADGAAAAGGG